MDLQGAGPFHLGPQRPLPGRRGLADPGWHAWAVVIGMATSVVGMFLRYLAHRKNLCDIKRAERKAEQR